MANQRDKGRAKQPSGPQDESEPRPEDRGRPERDKEPRNGEVDEGLEDTFPASDPPAPSRPTGAK